jgi:AraC family transcriptional regulator
MVSSRRPAFLVDHNFGHALAEAWEGTNGEVELRGTDNVLDARVSALAATLNTERIAGFPNGRLFLDSIDQALAIALVHGYTVRDRAVRTYRGGLGPARLRGKGVHRRKNGR